MIDAMSEEAAVQFLKSHVAPANYPSVRQPAAAALQLLLQTGTGLTLTTPSLLFLP